jgi:hypothetical protein
MRKIVFALSWKRLVVSMAVHGTLNPELGAKARVDIYTKEEVDV